MIRYAIAGEEGLCRQYSHAALAQKLDALHAIAADAWMTAKLGDLPPAVVGPLDEIRALTDAAIEAFVIATEPRP